MNRTSLLSNYLWKNPQLRYLFLELTRDCNLRCLHCGSSCGLGEEQSVPIETDILISTIDDVMKNRSPKELLFCITGGEPLLRKDWDYICRHITESGFHWGLTSNGTLIDCEMVEKLHDVGMKTISISIDGLEKSHELLRRVPGCFKKAIRACTLLKNSGYFQDVSITTAINKINIKEIEAIYKLVLELGVDSWKITNVESIGHARQHQDLLLEKEDFLQMFSFVKKVRCQSKIDISYGCSHFLPVEYDENVRDYSFLCGAGTLIASISCEGDILPCLDIDNRFEVRQGNIKYDSFWHVWQNKFEQFRRSKAEQSTYCRDCDTLKECQGDSWHTWDFNLNRPQICCLETINHSI